MIRRAAAVSLALVLLTWGVLYAHAALVSSVPAAGTSVATSPSELRLVFSEEVAGPLSRILLVDAAGRTDTLPVTNDPRDVRTLVAPTPTLGAGAYRVAWRVVSADGHVVDGSYVFSVAVPVPDSGAQPPMPVADGGAGESGSLGPEIADASLVLTVLRAAGITAVMALAGLLYFLVVVGAPAARRPERVAGGLAVAAPLLLGAHALAWLVSTAPEHRLTGAWTQSILATPIGMFEVSRIALAVLALWAFWLARRPGLALVFAVSSVFVSGPIGHPSALHPLWAIPLTTVHLAAVSAWLGGVLWLTVRERDDLALLISEAGKVSSLALIAAIVAAVTGVTLGLLFLPNPIANLGSPYGLLVVSKIIGLFILVAFGAYHRLGVLPRLREAGVAGGFQQTLRNEVVVMCLVVMIGAFMAYVPPAGHLVDGSAAEPEHVHEPAP